MMDVWKMNFIFGKVACGKVFHKDLPAYYGVLVLLLMFPLGTSVFY